MRTGFGLGDARGAPNPAARLAQRNQPHPTAEPALHGKAEATRDERSQPQGGKYEPNSD